MKIPRAGVRAVLAALALLAGCAPKPVLVSTMPEAPAVTPRPAVIGATISALPPDAVDAVAAQYKAELERRLQATGARLQFRPQPAGVIGLRMPAAESFETGSAQLQVAALTRYSEIAEVLKTYAGCVAHVLVYGDSMPEGDLALTLGARRAASILDYLVRRGVPPTRMRAEGRLATEAGEQIELVLKPLVAGRESQAWTPPD